MLTLSAEAYDRGAAVEELLNGSGAVRIRGVYCADQVARARQIVMDHSDHDPGKVTHFNAEADEAGKLSLQRRVWNLFPKGDVFGEMITHPVMMQTMADFLGSEFVCGSYCASRLLPGCPGQEPHIDYPYWDFYNAGTFPVAINSSFPMNAQATIILDPFTEETGATAFVPGSQRALHYPDENDRFFENCERMTGDPGDLVFFFGAAWHCAMPNNSSQDRTGLLIEFLPKFVKPVEDMLTGVDEAFLAGAGEEIRQLLGLNYPYPQLFDQSEAKNEIGRAEAG